MLVEGFATSLIGYGFAHVAAESFREPDVQLVKIAAQCGLHMGQWVTISMIVGGLHLVSSAGGRTPPRTRAPCTS
jgi:phosphatidylglycerol:prolipoprotein diacylglycerol transferase